MNVLLFVYISYIPSGTTEDDQNTLETFNDEQVIECMKECVCLKLQEDSLEAKQLKEYCMFSFHIFVMNIIYKHTNLRQNLMIY